MTSKDELWASFMENMARSTQLQLRAQKARDAHAKGGSYCPYSDTPNGVEMDRDIRQANKAAQDALDLYLQQPKKAKKSS